ncbi:hypothetical protein [Streptomyces sp. NPDC048659]|uniref:hypothetical protein n=1 Tax=Streptomyces sp. NPDC048659 TaxID=3155489 RepID=UPI00341F8463
MDGTAWARFRRHRWLPGAVLVLLAVTVAAGFVLVRAERRESGNTGALERACGGVLPRDAVRALLPEDGSWSERSGPGPRGLVACGVGVSGGEGGWLQLTAVPVLAPPLVSVRVEGVAGDPFARAPRWVADHRWADATATVGCAGGLPGYPRPVTSFHVYGDLSTVGDAAPTGWAGHLAEAVAAVAEDLRTAHGCGGPAVRPADVRPAPRAAPDGTDGAAGQDGKAVRAACDWFRAARLGPGWGPTGDASRGAEHPGARACVTGGLNGERTAAVTSASWWGELLPEARTEYGRELALVGRGTAPGGRRSAHTVAAWAEARCGDGPALHRVSVTAAEKDGLADRAEALLGRYLEAAHCRDVTRLGTVWK